MMLGMIFHVMKILLKKRKNRAQQRGMHARAVNSG
jgi:hypothetical protein